MDSRYDHLQHENSVHSLWEKANAFAPVGDKDPSTPRQHFSIVMPPPNANDPLHIGHAMFVSLEDIMIRYHRMLGDDTLWLPGTDHAGIETQFVFEKKLKKEGKSRFHFDRHTLYQMIWDYVQQNSDIAVNQLKKMGASCDWNRFRFMLDPKLVTTVLETFSRLHQEKMVYRDLKLVNYCTKCGTSFSELEVVHVERTEPLYYLKYGPFVIATVRIETKFRDTALAVNPNDPRYQDYLGKTIEVQGLLGPIKMTVIADEEVDPDFGTGIMKVTPAHDPHDFELGIRYDLPVTPIIDFNGRMDFRWYLDNPDNNNPLYRARAEKYHGKKVAEARQLMAEDLKTDGLIDHIDEKYTHNVGTCYRCGTTIEPLPLPQFFIKVAPLVKPVLKALKEGEVTIHGAGHDKILHHWLKNLKDWNISRQIVWGIRIPVWYKVDLNPDLQVTFLSKTGELVSGKISEMTATHGLETIKTGLQQLSAPVTALFEVSPTSPGPNYLQETDTFDTWFSSGQWPYSTLQSTTADQQDFKRFYPTSVMETGYDILPFWVMRMLLLGVFATGNVPFKHVYLHGLVRDQKGQKMSKSKGNVSNPLEIIEKYGADALRLALVIRSSPGLDKSVGDPDFKAMRNFTNKIWNAARFVMSERPATAPATTENLTPDTTILDDALFTTTLADLVNEVTQQLNDFRLGLAAETLYNSFWHWYCDQAIEAGKTGRVSQENLLIGLKTYLKLLHPFVPFVTEAVWQELNRAEQTSGEEKLLVASAWPSAQK